MNERTFAGLKAALEAKQNENPTVCYWPNCENERIEHSVFCHPHAVRDAIINHTLFRRPGRAKTESD